jgi:hypothetical protein
MKLTNSHRARAGAGDLLPGTYSEGSAAMVDSRVEQLTGKLQRLRALRFARAGVRQLERELRAGRAGAEEPPSIPEFLRQRRYLQSR